MAKPKFKNIDKIVIKIDKSLKEAKSQNLGNIWLREDDSHFDA